METTGNAGLDALADAIAKRVAEILQDPGEERLMDVARAAKYIGRSEKGLRHMIATGAIPAVREGGRIHLDRKDLDDWIEFRKSKGVL